MLLFEKLSGTQVALIDDVQADAKPIQDALEERHINTEFFEVNLEFTQKPEKPIESIELVFLDLYYAPNVSFDFDPYRCAQIVKSIVPEGKKYILVVWSRDIDKSHQVLDILNELNLSPTQIITKSKEDFQLSGGEYDVEKLLKEINVEVATIVDVLSFYGQILDVGEDSILVDCLIDRDSKKFQRRRFDRLPFDNAVDLTVGSFMFIRVLTKPGSKIFEFSSTKADISALFSKKGAFDGIDKSIFKGE